MIEAVFRIINHKTLFGLHPLIATDAEKNARPG